MALLLVAGACMSPDPDPDPAPTPPEDIITEVQIDEDHQFAPFVEPEFPFIHTSLVVSVDEGETQIPDMNIVPRCLALILGESSYACFDMYMLRWAAACTGYCWPREEIDSGRACM